MEKNKDIKILSQLFEETTAISVRHIERIGDGGGDRRYYRIQGDTAWNGFKSVVGVAADSQRDARAFVRLSEVFRLRGVSVPKIYGQTDDCMFYLEEDLGNRSLLSELSSPDAERLILKTIDDLILMQHTPYDELKDALAYKDFSSRQALWDLNYFKYEFVKPAAVDFDEDLLQDDFDRFAERLSEFNRFNWGFMMRDCQSRNVMLAPDPVLIDFQGGRYGPCLYDAVSFLWQAKAGFSPEFRKRALRYYADRYASYRNTDPESMLCRVDDFVLFRTLQVLGAYGFRGLVEKRAHFIESIPAALENLRDVIEKGACREYPELERVCRELISLRRFRPEPSDGKLHIKVFSFSYKKGYPEDLTGNGGGFMFDCRGMHNPGRYEEYKPLTGRDKPVIDFLKERGEVDDFVSKAVEIVSPSVETYIRRKFSNLQIGFGCTGGRHRSVYCADACARELARLYPDAVVEVIHRERAWKEIL